ncbi:hypothetical protein GCM10009431_16090 [Gaetbulibacter jejuensis]|uniref:Uncharacterized protein n=1 Tax=Gaetbulibacter jejuensis TaxID=584607 RepID=A0ABN1JP66_9FLAO
MYTPISQKSMRQNSTVKNTDTQNISFIRKLIKDEPEKDIINAKESSIGFASLMSFVVHALYR